MLKKLATIFIVAVATVISCTGAAGSSCDAGSPSGGGKPKKVVLYILPGETKITSDHYGMWHAVDGATPNCRWVVLQKGKVIQSGSWHDRIVIGTFMKGAVITMSTYCYKFEK